MVRRAIAELHGLGLKVMLKPHVDVEDGTWRAQITPTDASRWFESYAAFLDHYVAIAVEGRVEMLVIGTELASMSGARYAGAWATLIARIRARYDGLLTYAANGVEPADEFTSVSFWPALDLLGVDVYTPLTDKANPTRAELEAGWRRNRYGHDMVAAFSEPAERRTPSRSSSPRSATGAATAPTARPGTWGASLAPDPAEQADCYAALYAVWSREGAWMKGPFWWAWDVAAPGAGDTGYNPRGKPAEHVLRAVAEVECKRHEPSVRRHPAGSASERRSRRHQPRLADPPQVGRGGRTAPHHRCGPGALRRPSGCAAARAGRGVLREQRRARARTAPARGSAQPLRSAP